MRRIAQETDVGLVFTILFLLVFGIIMVYSSSYYAAYAQFGNHYGYLIKQLQWSALGLVFMYIVSKIPYRFIGQFWVVIYVFAVALQVLVLFVGSSSKGAMRWFKIGGISIQPSEISKVAVIIVLAVLLSQTSKFLNKFKAVMFNCVVLSVPVLLIFAENMSAAIIVAAIGVGMMFIAMPDARTALKYYGPFAAFIFFMVFNAKNIYMMLNGVLKGYQMDRLRVYFEGPWSDPSDTGYQTIQSLYAIGSGGLFGKGLGYSMQKNGFIPEAHNDIIFSVICEELGLFGAIALILLFMILIWRCMYIAVHAKDQQGVLLAIGVMVQIAVQVIMNIAVVTNSMPNTGVTMPFISYGGSAMLILMVEMGLVLNVARSANRMEFNENL